MQPAAPTAAAVTGIERPKVKIAGKTPRAAPTALPPTRPAAPPPVPRTTAAPAPVTPAAWKLGSETICRALVVRPTATCLERDTIGPVCSCSRLAHEQSVTATADAEAGATGESFGAGATKRPCMAAQPTALTERKSAGDTRTSGTTGLSRNSSGDLVSARGAASSAAAGSSSEAVEAKAATASPSSRSSASVLSTATAGTAGSAGGSVTASAVAFATAPLLPFFRPPRAFLFAVELLAMAAQ
mmetsp:Transcript_53967/g.154968  ORF Transcript_53967/g.154968 Transcript_53967/m.154968 type:complete len:243 (+) Transcript_53967:489-1217(+)